MAFEFEKKISTTARNYNITERDVIYCHLLAAGITRADAYHIIYNRSIRKQRAAIDAEAAQHAADLPGIPVLVQKIKTRAPINTTSTQNEVREEIRYQEREEEETQRERELKTRAGLIARTARELADVHGKDAVQGLVSLAKLQGYDKEDTREEEEKRRYFLPWRSRCRGCQLMKIWRDLEHEEEEQATGDKANRTR